MADKIKVVVIGAGFGGLKVCGGLAKRPDVEVTLLDKTNHHTFQPLLYQVATAGLNASDVANPARTVFSKQKNLEVLMGEMTGVDYDRRIVSVDHGALELPYDYLVLATGGRTSYFGNDEWEKFAPGMKTLTDAIKIRNDVLYAFERAERETNPEEVKRLMTIVVIGGGPTGVELSGAFSELRAHVLRWDFKRIQPQHARIVLIEGSPHVLGSFEPELQEYGRKHLTKMGVEVKLSERVKDVTAGIVTTDKGTYEAANIIWAAGVEAYKINEQLAPELDKGNRIKVSADLRIPGHERVYCIGDAASFAHPCSNKGKPHPGVAQVALQMGVQVARNIQNQIDGQAPGKFTYSDRGSMATIGRSAGVLSAKGIRMTGFIAWVGWLFVHLIYLLDFQNRMLVLNRWFWGYLTWKWGVRIITLFPAPPLPPEVFPPLPPEHESAT